MPLKEGGGHGMTMIPLRPTSHQNSKEPFKVRYAEFAPKGNAIVFVDYDNNIYYKPGVMEQARNTATLSYDQTSSFKSRFPYLTLKSFAKTFNGHF